MDDLRELQVQIETRGDVPASAAEPAARKVRSALRTTHEPVLFARVKLSTARDPAVERPAVAQVNIGLNGRLIRAQAVAETMSEAIDRMHDRLRVRLQRAARNREAIRGHATSPTPNEWRHRSPRTRRPPCSPGPLEDRVVIRHKSYALGRQTPEEAIAEMELLDYDFHLFTERETGQDSVVYRTESGYQLDQRDERLRLPSPLDTSITVSEVPAPILSLAQATARLEALGRPFLFFVDSATHRGNLLYHRYDGHYGLITPTDTRSRPT